MKLSQKAKYFTFGVVATAVLLPLAIYAVETIPITFGEGDVISASVMNNVLKRVNDTQRGFANADEILGSWSCTTYKIDTGSGACTGGTATPGGLLGQRTQTITFSKSGSTYSWNSTFAPGTCESGSAITSADFELLGGNKLASIGQQYKSINTITKITPAKFTWDINAGISGGGTTSYVVCEKASVAPAPADALAATVSGSTAVLTWTDQSTDETGFKVQRKTSVTGAWTDLTTTAANAVTYTDSTVTTGTYWYRVLATNANGDAMSSSEVQAVLP